MLIATLIIAILLSVGPGAAVQAVLSAQPPDEVAAVALVRQSLPTDNVSIVAAIPDRLPLAKYSAIAHLIKFRVPVTVTANELQAIAADYLLWDQAARAHHRSVKSERHRIGEGRFVLYAMRGGRGEGVIGADFITSGTVRTVYESSKPVQLWHLDVVQVMQLSHRQRRICCVQI